MRHFFQKLSQINLFVILLIVSIASIGFLMLVSAAEGSAFPWAYKQMIRFGVGMILLAWVAITDIRLWMHLAYPLYAVALLLLIGVELIGFVGMGAQRWIDLYVIQIQPSELMKVFLVLALARYFQDHPLEQIHQIRHLIFPLILVLLPTLLVMKQPDLGTAMIFILCSGALFFLAGVKIWKFLTVIGASIAAMPLLWHCLHDYQKQRILIFLNPESDQANTGYHVTQSKIALGSGGWWGRGFMQGTQSHLNFLPEKQTDFIFTMFSEEFGFVGGVALIFLYSILIFYGYYVAITSRSHFGRLVALGMTTIIFLYVFINISMVMGMLPVVGVPLPLVSYGGTAMLTLLVGVGLIISAGIHYDVRIGRG